MLGLLTTILTMHILASISQTECISMSKRRIVRFISCFLFGSSIVPMIEWFRSFYGRVWPWKYGVLDSYCMQSALGCTCISSADLLFWSKKTRSELWHSWLLIDVPFIGIISFRSPWIFLEPWKLSFDIFFLSKLIYLKISFSPEHSDGAKFVKLFVGSVPSTVTEEDVSLTLYFLVLQCLSAISG